MIRWFACKMQSAAHELQPFFKFDSLNISRQSILLILIEICYPMEGIGMLKCFFFIYYYFLLFLWTVVFCCFAPSTAHFSSDKHKTRNGAHYIRKKSASLCLLPVRWSGWSVTLVYDVRTWKWKLHSRQFASKNRYPQHTIHISHQCTIKSACRTVHSEMWNWMWPESSPSNHEEEKNSNKLYIDTFLLCIFFLYNANWCGW